MVRFLFQRAAPAFAAAALAAMVFAATADAGHVRPLGATPKRDSLVIAYAPCGAPALVHGGAFGVPSCPGPVPVSPWLTAGEPTANGLPAAFIGSSRLDVCPAAIGCPVGDIGVTVSLAGVKCTPLMAAAVPGACPFGALMAYAGTVNFNYPITITDHCNAPAPGACPPGIPPPPGGPPATTTPFVLPLPMIPCVPVGAGATSTCAVVTTVNAMVPAAIAAGQRMNISIGTITASDGGPDAMAATAPNTVFATAGVFVP